MPEKKAALSYMSIPPSRPYLRSKDRERLMNVFDSGMIAYGDETRMFEDEVSRYLGLAGGVATNQGMSAAHVALEALGISKGDEVIVPSYVCSSVHRAIELTGAKPVLADIEWLGYNLDIESAKNQITNRTEAIFFPQMFGNPGNAQGLAELTEDEGFYLIEDCAQSLGAEINGRKVGSFGDAAICSFKATKVISGGEGGMALFKKKADAERCRELVTTDKRPCGYGNFYGYIMSDLTAALARSQFEDIDSFVKARKNIAKWYDATFEGIGFSPLDATNRENSIHFRYVVAVENPSETITEMKKYGVSCGMPVNLPIHRDENFQKIYDIGAEDFPNSDKAYLSIVFIPIYPSMNEEMVNHVCSSIEEVWKKQD